MDQKPIIRMGAASIKQLGGQRHPRAISRPPLKVSAKRQADYLLRGRVTTRDLELVRALIGVGVLTRHQIQRLFFNDHPKVASNRLAKLYRYHFLDRTAYWLEDMAQEGFDPCFIYTAATVGLEVFARRMGLARAQVPFNEARYTLERSDHLLLHDLWISEMFTRLRVAAGAQQSELLWFNEMAAILSRGQEELVRPDGLAVFLSGERPQAYFIEMDRGHTEWDHKVQAYEAAQRLSPWRETLTVEGWQPSAYPAVLAVVPDGMAGEVAGRIAPQAPQRTHFYLKEWGEFLTTDTFAAWRKAGAAAP